MGQSYRIRTTPGDDKNIVIKVEQDFEQLEVLSLKIRQSDVYTRMCSDYGVIAGRVFANNGYGIPNAKLSIFIPIKPEDEDNPVISSIYPYKNLEQTNEDGYRYNLLPYVPSYTNHVPTGTFPTRLDALVNQTVVELYDKYYKYTVTTNDSGDFLIFGVPVGTQTIVMNVDLSDIGEFSLTPQDLVRMGVATEEQFDGVKFKSSSNFNQLPQIIVINKTIEIVPFWGEKDVCQIGITRSDFDLTSEANIDIQPTSIFMGSLMSSNEKSAVKSNGIAQKSTGDLCKLITGPGEIIGLTQSIYRDSNGLPIIERADLPNGGKLIDSAGAWLFDLPMNQDYVFTNEFGQQVLSNDPSVGVPTKAKYRFKIKWQQSTSVSEDYKRGYYLVPNVKERGWNGGFDPTVIQFVNPNYETDPDWLDFQKSYAFSLDWSAYTNGSVSITNPDIQDIINCEDYFYEFEYNKVYTVSSFIDNYKIANNKEKFIGIKRIDDDTCEDVANRYPVNDGVFHTSLIWRVFNFLLIILGIIGLPLIILYSLIAYLWKSWLKVFFFIFLELWAGYNIVQSTLGIIAAATPSIGFGATVWVAGVIYYSVMLLLWLGIAIALIIVFARLIDYDFPPLKLPMITYPDCDVCDCSGDDNGGSTLSSAQSSTANAGSNSGLLVNFANLGVYSDVLEVKFTDDFPQLHQERTGGNGCFYKDYDYILVLQLLSGNLKKYNSNYGVQLYTYFEIIGSDYYSTLYTDNMPFGERLNQFNTKANYYNGTNQISLQIEPNIPTNSNKQHLDNVIVFIGQAGTYGDLGAGSMFSFVGPKNSKDPNITGGTLNSFGTKSITGTTDTGKTSVTIIYGKTNTRIGNEAPVTYALTASASTDEKTYQYSSDIEYFQVVTGMTITQFRNLQASTPLPNTLADIIESKTNIIKRTWYQTDYCIQYVIDRYQLFSCSHLTKNIDYIDNNSIIYIAQRGVDPYSPKYPTKVGLGKLLGFSNINGVQVNTSLRLNIPIRNIDPTIGGSIGNELCYIHRLANDNLTVNNGQKLWNPSYFFTPSNQYSGYTTNLTRYYSALDTTTLNYVIDPTNAGNTSISGKVILNNNNNSSKDITSNSNNYLFSNTNIPQKYSTQDSLVGGTFMYMTKPGIAGVGDGCYGAPGNGINQTTPQELYFSFIYPTGYTTNMSDKNNIVMRSDRLPSSDGLLLFSTGSTAYTNYNNVAMMNQNPKQNMYIFTDSGVLTVGGGISSPQYNTGDFLSGNNAFYGTVLNTFDCAGMVQFNCYSGNGINFGVSSNCTNTDAVENGCYVFVREPLKGLFNPKSDNDITRWSEYVLRFRFFYALCQGVLSNVFVNNWVNGNLYAFPFKVDTYYNKLNQVYKRKFPFETVMLQYETNNFYYRSSPAEKFLSSYRFVGAQSNGDTDRGANYFDIKTPTTIMNLGPRDEFLKEIILSPNYYGYNMKKISQTSYTDLSDMINFFSIIRVIDTNFWRSLLSTDMIKKLFSRGGSKGYRVDADFAQSSAINSQIGVIPFDSDYYDSTGTNPALIAAGFGANNIMMGIFFESTTEDMQVRDFISPMRIIRYNTNTNSFVYDYIPNKSQIVPNYKWKVQTGGYTLFGKQTNDWVTTPPVNGFYAQKYQSLDRLTSDYPRAGSLLPNEYNSRGYLFAQSAPITLTVGTPLIVGNVYTIINYVSPDNFLNVGATANTNDVSFIATGTTPSSWVNSTIEASPIYLTGATINPNPALAGAPWYFYFGLKKGETAINKFYTKYIGETTLNE